MTCSIHYSRPDHGGDAGLIIVKKTELAAQKARLEATGFTITEISDVPMLGHLLPKAS